MKAVVIRHGETQWNVEGRLQGGLDSDLTLTGIEQMKRVARYCQRLDAVRLFCSSARRAQQSAELIVAGNSSLAVEVCPNLREYEFGDLEGKTRAEVERIYPDYWRRWLTHQHPQSVPRAEVVSGFFERVRGFLGELAALNGQGPVLVVTHGGVIRVLISLILELEAAMIDRLSPSNGGISILEFRGTGPRLSSFNETGHLHME